MLWAGVGGPWGKAGLIASTQESNRACTETELRAWVRLETMRRRSDAGASGSSRLGVVRANFEPALGACPGLVDAPAWGIWVSFLPTRGAKGREALESRVGKTKGEGGKGRGLR